jgi:hypothetical protein
MLPKVVGEHSHPKSTRVGGLTNNANKMKFAFADDCRMGLTGTPKIA